MILWEPRLDAAASRWKAVAAQSAAEVFGPVAARHDQAQTYAHGNVDELVRTGLAAMFVPQVYGGQGASLTATVAAIEEVAAQCASTAAIMGVYQLGAFPLLLAGTEEHKHRYLAELAAGRATSFALSERVAGSDAAALQTVAEEENGGWRLRGEKYWIGNGGISRYYVVFAKHLQDQRVSAFLVDGGQEGVEVSEVVDKMGLRATQTSNLRLDVWLPAASLIGERGAGLTLASKTLNVGRLTVSAQATGLARRAYFEASARAVQRSAFGKPLIDHQGIGFKLADAATQLSAARLMLYEAAAAYDAGQPIETLAAMTKLFASEASHGIVDTAVQVWGGQGYCWPNPVERLYRDQRIIEIYEGSSEIQRMVLARRIAKQTTQHLSTSAGESL